MQFLILLFVFSNILCFWSFVHTSHAVCEAHHAHSSWRAVEISLIIIVHFHFVNCLPSFSGWLLSIPQVQNANCTFFSKYIWLCHVTVVCLKIPHILLFPNTMLVKNPIWQWKRHDIKNLFFRVGTAANHLRNFIGKLHEKLVKKLAPILMSHPTESVQWKVVPSDKTDTIHASTKCSWFFGDNDDTQQKVYLCCIVEIVVWLTAG